MDNIDRLENFLLRLLQYADFKCFIYHFSQWRREFSNLAKRKKKDSATDTEDLLPTDVEFSVLQSINKKLDLLESVHSQIKDIKSSLNFAYDQIEQLQTENKLLQTTVATLTKQVETLTFENRRINETLLEIQTRSMRDNWSFLGSREILLPVTQKHSWEILWSRSLNL